MSIQIHLNNRHYQWTNREISGVNYWYKGEIFFKNKLYKWDDIVDLIIRYFDNEDGLGKILNQFNGQFALVIRSPKYSVCIVDRIRSIPLFYVHKNNCIIISDDANYLRNRIDSSISCENLSEFLIAGYVTGENTLFEEIFQLQAGECLIYEFANNHLFKCFYHIFLHKNFYDLPEELLLDCFDKVLVNVFQRLIDSVRNNNLKIVVPLSGGLDSRIIVVMLKRLGVEDVICYSYGRRNNLESNISKQVAESLGYHWFFVEYTGDKLYNSYQMQEMKDYLKYAGNLVSLPITKDFLAILELRKKGLIPNNAVFVPGHSLDMLAGSHIPENYVYSMRYSYEKGIIDIVKAHYRLQDWQGRTDLSKCFHKKVCNSVGKLLINNNESCANIIELFDFKERQSKFIVNWVRVHEFFGYEWRLPLWDAELIDFYLKVPINYRLKRRLQIDYVIKCLFINEFQCMKQIKCTTPLIFIKDTFINKLIFSLNSIFIIRLGSNCINSSYMPIGMKKTFHFFFKYLIKIKRCIFFKGKEVNYGQDPLAYLEYLSKEKFFKNKPDWSEDIHSFLVIVYVKIINPSKNTIQIINYFTNKSNDNLSEN